MEWKKKCSKNEYIQKKYKNLGTHSYLYSIADDNLVLLHAVKTKSV